MSKKHFEALAKALKANRPLPELVGFYKFEEGQWLDGVGRIADVCASFNVNFDRARFLKACGVEV